MKAAIVGMGKMGRAIDRILLDHGHTVAARVDAGGDDHRRTLTAAIEASQPDVAFEFTTPAAACENVRSLIRLGVPTVCGTTGWSPSEVEKLASDHGVPVLVAANFSIGVAALKRAVEAATKALAAFDAFEAGIVERHHNAKLDAPSGTARMLAATVAEQSGAGLEVPIVSLRLGGQPGEHSVILEGPAECVTLTHQVHSRDIFADGAVRAAEWLLRDEPRGLVSFDTFLERMESWTQD